MTSHDPDHVRRAYDEMTFDHPPGHQMVADVHRTVRRRRRNRTAALAAGVAATVVVGIAGAAAWPGREPAPGVVADAPAAITITTPDGQETALSGFTARCVAATDDDTTAGVLMVESTGTGDTARAVVRFKGEASDLSEAGTLTFPVDENDPGVPRLVELFAAVEAGASVLEATTTAVTSSGTIDVREASCGDEPRVDADVDLTLGTEGDPSEGLVRVTGTLRTP